MRARSILAPLLLMTAASGSACSQTPVVVPLRSMERPRDVDFICLAQTAGGTWEGVPLDSCASNFDNTPKNTTRTFRLHAVVSQVSRGELAVVDLGRVPGDSAALTKADPRIPGYSFIPVGAAPTDVVADPLGRAVFVASGRDPRIDVLPSQILRGPIDTKAASTDPPPWPRIEFDRATEGIPAAMAVVRERVDEKDTVRLYVTLPEATPSAKIAVFDLTASAITPSRIGDIPLGAPAPMPLVVRQPTCGPSGQTAPWWAKYDTCGGENRPIPGGEVTPDTTTTDFHLAGVSVAGGKLFAADDHAPVIHVYDIKGGAGLEIRRIAIGGKTSRLAVSPVVPDEVTFENSAAIDTCIARGWLGDGLDHSAESTVVDEVFKGRCRAHRYLYAIDLVNDEAGNGSIAVVDLPVTFGLDASNQIKKTAEGAPAEEKIDIDGAELVQPMACDAPNFPTRRLPVGPFGLNGNNVVPARSIAFLEVDPPKTSTEKFKAVRCRPFKDHPNFVGREFEGVPAAEAEARRRIGEAWSDAEGPRRLRGVFAWVALANGALVVVDIDDYDSVCRGPIQPTVDRPEQQLFLYPDETIPIRGNPDPRDPKKIVSSATDEYYTRIVRRHHPRSLRTFEGNMVPAVTGVTFSRFDNVLSNDPTNDTGRRYPHFAALAPKPNATSRAPLVLTSPDNPYAITTETWTVTYEGALPGFTGSYGALDDQGGAPVISDPAAGFCRKGVEATGAVEQHDVVQLLDSVCQFDDSCTAEVKQQCLAEFGEADERPLKKSRSLLIEKVHDDKVVLAERHFDVNGAILPGRADVARIKQCFGAGVLRYTVRSSGNWVVVGSVSGFLHRQIVDPASTDKACITDLTKPRIHQGRVTTQVAPLTLDQIAASRTPIESNLVVDDCARFTNPSWKFAIRSGLDCTTDPTTTATTCVPAASLQDMRFTFSGRFAWQPFSLGAGSLTASMRPVAAYWDGLERLNWNMIAVVDAVDRGLLVFPALEPFSFQKGAN